jgi:ketosteroid isomerase-like protein
MSQRPNAQIVADFYAALSSGDPDAVAAAIDAHFAEDAAIEWPPSLPHGGRIESSRRLRGLFTGIAKAGNQAGATNLTLVRTIGDGDHVVAWITFDWKNPGSEHAVPNSALEVWSFSGDQVQEIKAFYWDGAAISQPQNA